MKAMQSDLLFFFQAHPKALPLYEALEKQILQRIDGVAVRVKKAKYPSIAVIFLPASLFCGCEKRRTVQKIILCLPLG